MLKIVEALVEQFDGSVLSSRTDGVYDFLTIEVQERQAFIMALPDDVDWERSGGDRVTITVERPFDRANSW